MVIINKFHLILLLTVLFATPLFPTSFKDRSLSGKIPKGNFSDNIEYYDRQGNRHYRAGKLTDPYDDRHLYRKLRSESYMYQRPDGVYIHWGDGRMQRGPYHPRRHHRLREGPYMYQRPDGLYIHWGKDKYKSSQHRTRKNH